MPFVPLNSSDEDTTLKSLGEIPPGTLFVFEDELVVFSEIKILTDEEDADGYPQYVWLADGTLGTRYLANGTLGSRHKDTPVIVVNLPVGTPTRA